MTSLQNSLTASPENLIPLNNLDEMFKPLADLHEREFSYLRLSVTEVCNYSCNYCLPDGYQCESKTQPLSVEEIKHLISVLAQKGIKKVRITGGEPSLRRDLSDIIRVIKNTPGIEQVALTTNGYKLEERITSWVKAGLDSINISVDSLDPEMFKLITGHNRLEKILAGLKKAQSLNMKSIKVNAVLLKEYNLNQFDQFISWIKETPISLRFIELMETSDNREYFHKNHVSGESIEKRLKDSGWVKKDRGPLAGPANEYAHPDYQGNMGLIMPYSKDFCDSCNRLRVSSSGQLHLCLFGEQGLPLRHLCQHDDPKALQQQIIEYVKQKKVSHFLQQGETGATKHLAMIGG